MRILLLIAFVFFTVSAIAQKYINPEGYYDLISNGKLGDLRGRVGDIQVKVLSKHKVVIVIYGCTGEPSYSSGTLHDTVLYKDNKVLSISGDDSTCKISIQFTPKSAIVIQETKHYRSGCGFGHAVFVGGTYKKRKRIIEDLIHPQTSEIIKE